MQLSEISFITGSFYYLNKALRANNHRGKNSVVAISSSSLIMKNVPSYTTAAFLGCGRLASFPTRITNIHFNSYVGPSAWWNDGLHI